MRSYDVVVIGAGPGGYVAAIRCAQLGLKTACVDEWLDPDGKPALGGTCLNVGCIPSKALLDTSHHYFNLTHLLPKHGIQIQHATVDIAAMQQRKQQVVRTLTGGIAGLFRKNKVDWLQGHGALLPKRRVEISPHGDEEKKVVQAGDVIIATGSVPVEIAAAPLNDGLVVDSTGALDFEQAPKRLGIIGAGVIGLELGSVWSRLGSEVVLLEALSDFLTPVDRDIAKAAYKVFTNQGLDIRLGTRVTATTAGQDQVSVQYENSAGQQTLEVERLVVAVGRRAHTAGLNAEAIGLRLDAAGRIEVDEICSTGVEHIYAIGDAVAGPMLAHKASEEGIAVAEIISGQSAHIDHGTVPWVIYTHPEIAWVGRNEQELTDEGIAYRSGVFPFQGIGRAHGAGETEGLVKILGDAKSDRILGVHIFGAQASELIAEAVTAMQFHASSEDLARTVHAHPTLSEAMHEAALAVDRRALHI
jgi:dihydrolipoamide dehydrogenase